MKNKQAITLTTVAAVLATVAAIFAHLETIVGAVQNIVLPSNSDSSSNSDSPLVRCEFSGSFNVKGDFNGGCGNQNTEHSKVIFTFEDRFTINQVSSQNIEQMQVNELSQNLFSLSMEFSTIQMRLDSAFTSGTTETQFNGIFNPHLISDRVNFLLPPKFGDRISKRSSNDVDISSNGVSSISTNLDTHYGKPKDFNGSNYFVIQFLNESSESQKKSTPFSEVLGISDTENKEIPEPSLVLCLITGSCLVWQMRRKTNGK